ncbi:enoyl-CoA hydratase/isomerase family protein [Lysobacter sp. A6]|uniref:Enoyl-CoA hydratase/isomerase family protein n=1 Tax=Noviluteimonas lactosilytica TaxID=2888523 RepID=A0ABS8JJ55_9GAMM|nr:enoyl-CoA hydratase/isomerase family protein [Lysobacter lactosilyticus]MCC8363638.1 enoyl-CoA hydratase/isomerase family protein [Lysobacter lactosilyticus]
MLVERIPHGPIVELKLARAPVNALNPDLCNNLRTALAEAIDGGAQGIVLSGGPKVFSAGLDVPFLLSLGEDRAALMSAWSAFFDAARALAESPVPVAAALAGHAPAGGCVLALCCDYRVMAEGPFSLGLNETQVGLVAPEGVQTLMRRIVGPHRAERLLVGGQMIDSATAHAIGLVDELTNIDDVATRARVWLEGLIALPREPMLRTRAISRADVVAAMQPENIRLERFVDAWAAPDTQKGLRALMARLGK